MKSFLLVLKKHLPYLVGVVLIVLNVLIDQHVFSLSDQSTNLVNALLAAFGLGVLHKRQQ